MKFSEFSQAVRALAHEYRPGKHCTARVEEVGQDGERRWSAYVAGEGAANAGSILVNELRAAACLAGFRAHLTDVSVDVVGASDSDSEVSRLPL